MPLHRNHIVIAALFGPVLQFLAPAATAQPQILTQDQPLTLVVGSSVTWDSNVFRLPEPTSDRVTSSYVGLRFDQAYAQQRFLLDLIQSAQRYDRLSYLNFDPLQYRAAWQWRLRNRLSGTLSADRNEALVNYGDFRDTSQRNIRTAESRLFSADAWLFGGWHLTGGVSLQEARNSVLFLQQRGNRTTGADAGIKYVTRSGSSLALSHRSEQGEYLQGTLDPFTLVDDGFRRSDNDVQATWIITAKSTLDARLAHVDYRSNHFTQRNFSGMAGRLRYRWDPAATLSINVAASRDLSPSSDSFSYRVEERLLFGPVWRIGPRTAVALSLDRVAVNYRQPVFPSVASHHDDLRSAGASVDWRLSRTISLRAALQSHRRTSTEPSFAFRATVTTLGAALAL